MSSHAPNYEYKLWTDADSRKFIAEHYDWFLPVFDGYPYPIQRADAPFATLCFITTVGIYMDLDIGCLRRFDPLLRFEVILPKTIRSAFPMTLSSRPKGILSWISSSTTSSLSPSVLSNYPTDMSPRVPMFVSASYGLYVDATTGRPKHNQAARGRFQGVRVCQRVCTVKTSSPSMPPDAFFSATFTDRLAR